MCVGMCHMWPIDGDVSPHFAAESRAWASVWRAAAMWISAWWIGCIGSTFRTWRAKSTAVSNSALVIFVSSDLWKMRHDFEGFGFQVARDIWR